MRFALLVLTALSLTSTANAMGGPGAATCSTTCVLANPALGGGVYCSATGLCECYQSYTYNNPSNTCNYSVCCASFNRDGGDVPILTERPGGRRLKEQERDTPIHVFREGDEAKYQDYVSKCGDYDYETALYVDKHLYAIASPSKEAEAAKCPHVVINAKFDVDDKRPQKVAMVYREKKHIDNRLNGGETHPMGTFKLSTLVKAYENTEPGLDTGFDILNNNCATIMVNLARNLEIKIDTSVTSYVANRLLQDAGGDLLNKIKSNLGLHKRNLRADMSDHELINGLTEQFAAEIMA